MISVIIPLYNKRKSVARTLASVRAQTFTDYEVVVVDDGSTDGSADVVRSLADERVRLITQSNSGVSAARNKGISEARGELIAFLDADDVWKPRYLEMQMELVANYPQCDVYAVNYEMCDAESIVTPLILKRLPFQAIHGELTNYFEVASHSHPPLCSISVMVRRTAILSIGGFPVGVSSGEDLLTWARLAVQFRIAYSKEVMAVYFTDDVGLSSPPNRGNDDGEYVASQLIALYKEFHPPFMRQYISHWYKMRSSVFMRLDQPVASIQETWKGIRCNPLNYKLYVFVLLNMIPSALRRRMLMMTKIIHK